LIDNLISFSLKPVFLFHLFVSMRSSEDGRQRPRVGKAFIAAVVAVAILGVVMITRFAIPKKDEPTSLNNLTTAPPAHEDAFTTRSANEQGRVCEILSAVLIPEEQSANANTKYVRLSTGRLVARISEPAYGPSVPTFKALLTSTTDSTDGSGDVIEDASVTFTQNAETKATNVDVEAPEGFSVVEVGAIVTDTTDGLQSKYLNPAPVDSNDFFYRYIEGANDRTLSLANVKPYALARSSEEKSSLCGTDNSNQIDPSTDPRCGGPYYIYTYAKVCKDGSVAQTNPLVELVFTNNLLPKTQEAFEHARNKWNGVIKNTFPSALLASGQTTIKCNGQTLTFPAGTKMLNGLMIFAMVHSIDGEGGVLAQAGPCAYSDGQFGFRLPRVGLMVSWSSIKVIQITLN
jgi:hypothetical protein